MALVTSNSQGELSPLEIGMHALHCVALSSGGRGQKGGLSEYAVRVGKQRQNIQSYRDGAEVASNVHIDMQLLDGKAQHLATIHALPESCWQPAVEIMLSKGWSAKETGEHVKAAREGVTNRGAVERMACRGCRNLAPVGGWPLRPRIAP